MESASIVVGGRRAAPLAWVVIAATFAMACAAPALGKDRREETPQVRVVGRAQVSAAPDRVSVDVSVVTRAEGASAAAAQNAARTTKVVEALRGAFADATELSTSGYTLQPDYTYDKREGRRKQVGFTARNTVHVVLSDVGQAGALIDAAVAGGANEVRSVRFGVGEPDAFEQQALEEAADDARRKAETLASSLGAKLGRTLRVEERGASAPRPQGAMLARAESDSTPIEPGDVYFEAHVALWVEIVEK